MICRRSAVITALLVLGATLPLRAAKPPRPLITRVQHEFLDKRFTTRIMIANSLTYYNTDHRRQLSRLIDTEVAPDGSIEYRVRMGHTELYSVFAPAFHIRPDAITGSSPPGGSVQVVKVESKNDRIEFWLAVDMTTQGGPRNAYGKLKFMLGDGFESRYTFESVMNVVSKALRLEAYERSRALEAEFGQLTAKLQDAQTILDGAAASAERLKAAREVRAQLQAITRNRAEQASSGSGRPTEGDGAYSRRLAEIEKVIDGLERETKGERIKEIRDRLARAVADGLTITTQLDQKKSVNSEDLAAREQLLDGFDRLLDDRKRLIQELEVIGEAVTPDERTSLAHDQEIAGKLHERVAREGKAIEARALDKTYAEMERARAAHADAYTRAFGTPQQGEEAQKLITHLRQMHENRLAAQKRGSADALAQAAALLLEIERTRRQQR